MTPFYYIDGPLKGHTIHGDFKPTEADGVTYRKTTYAAMFKYKGSTYRAWVDIAYCIDDLSPKLNNNVCMAHMIIEKFGESGFHPYLRHLIKELPMYLDGSELQLIEIEE